MFSEAVTHNRIDRVKCPPSVDSVSSAARLRMTAQPMGGFAMSKRIPLSRSKFAIVDDADFEWLNQWKWSALKGGSTWYAIRHDYETTPPGFIYMHRFILRTPEEPETHHLDKDGLNNQRANLISCTHEQHLRYHQPDREARARQLRDLGLSLNFMRATHSISAQELATRAGVCASTIYAFECGRYAPRPNTLARLRKALPGPWNRPANAHHMQVGLLGLRKTLGKTSRYVGVSWSKPYECWRAEIRVNRKLIWLGLFDSEEEAAIVWNAEALKRRGPKARLNVIEKPNARGAGPERMHAQRALPSTPRSVFND